MSRHQTSVALAGGPGRGTLGMLLAVAGVALTGLGFAAWLSFGPGDRSPVRFASFVIVPAVIAVTYMLSAGRRRRLLFVLVALLDLEAVLLGELPVEGMPVAVAIPLIGVALVTYLLPVEGLWAPYVAAWLASTIGVALGVVTWVQPDALPVAAWTLVPTFSIVDASGLLVLWQVNSRRAGALKAITEAESRYRELLDGVDLLAADIDASGRIAWANRFGSKLLGVDREAVVGTNWYETFVPEDRRAEARVRLAQLGEGRQAMPTHRESEIVVAGGERRRIRWNHVIRHDENGAFVSMASIGEDITAARRAEEAFRRVSELNNALVTSSPVPTTVIRLDRTVQLWNPALTDLLGWREDEVIGKPIPDLIPLGTDGTANPDVFGQAAHGRQVRGAPAAIKTRDGGVVHVRIFATALRDSEGRPFAVAAQAIDVTAQEAMETKLRESQKMEAVGRLAGGVAHDFNNSLTAIGGFASLIASATDDQAIREDAEAISASVRRAANLTRELLAYARRSFLQPEAIEVNALVAAIRPMLRRLLGEDVQVVIESGVDEAMVRVDPGQLEQALLNLGANGRDAMPEGGRLTIRTGRVEARDGDGEGGEGSGEGSGDGDGSRDGRDASRGEGAGTSSGESEAASEGDAAENCAESEAESGADGLDRSGRDDHLGWVTIAVTDTGLGIPAELQSQVFEPFFTTKPVGAGTGLGLPMVQGFVIQSGGRVSLHSAPGDGTTVEIWLPEVAATALHKNAPPEPPVTSGHGETILLVEDEPAVAAAGFQLLSRRGYRVLLADSGTTAIALLQGHREPIALVLLDVILPDMRGPQVAAAAATTHAEAAILYASGYSADTFVRRGEMAAGVDLIEKPYAPEQLAIRVRSAIEEKRNAVGVGSAS